MPAVLAGRTGWGGVPFGSVRAVSTPSQPPPAFAGGGAKAKLAAEAAPAFESPIPNPESPIPNPESPIPTPQSPIPHPQSPLPKPQPPIPHINHHSPIFPPRTPQPRTPTPPP